MLCVITLTCTANDVAMAPGEYLTLWNSSASTTVVYLVVLQVAATGPTFLEGCFRIVDAKGDVDLLLSSGTEDYFGGTCTYSQYIPPPPGCAPVSHHHNMISREASLQIASVDRLLQQGYLPERSLRPHTRLLRHGQCTISIGFRLILVFIC